VFSRRDGYPEAMSSVSLEALQHEVDAFYTARDWHQFQTLKDLAISTGIEAGELQQHFLWHRADEEAYVLASRRREIEDELADVLINCLNFARLASIDLGEIIERKLRELDRKYPVTEVKGRVIPHA
jgi:dCTP diphosphatase